MIEIIGMNPRKSYQVGLTWWDCDNNGRVQSVHIDGQSVIPATRLPEYAKSKQEPTHHFVAVPAIKTADGKVKVSVRSEGGSNAVISELWIYESRKQGDIVAIEIPEVQTKPKPGQQQVLILTGEDYAGHKWRQTAPVIQEQLEQDPRLFVTVLDDLSLLKSTKLDQYSAVILHFKNYNPHLYFLLSIAHPIRCFQIVLFRRVPRRSCKIYFVYFYFTKILSDTQDFYQILQSHLTQNSCH